MAGKKKEEDHRTKDDILRDVREEMRTLTEACEETKDNIDELLQELDDLDEAEEDSE